MKKVIIIFLILLIIGIVFYLGYNKYISDRFESLDGIGKMVYISVQEDEIVDYVIVNKYTLIPEDKREKLIEYMKDNNYRIKPGEYKFNQGESFSYIIKILDFIEIE